MIRISVGSGITGPLVRAEGQAVGASGAEFVRVIRNTLATQHGVDLDLEALGSIDHSTMEFLADCGDSVVIRNAPGYLSRWLEAARRMRNRSHGNVG